MNKGIFKADLYRIFKSKLSFVSLILAVAFPLFMSLMYYGIDLMMNALDDTEDVMFSLFNVRTLIASAYSLSDNLGLIIPIFAAIFVSLDLTNGTMRNKIISGASRTKVYLSHLFASMLYNAIIITTYALFTILFGLIFFDWGVEFAGEEVTRFIYLVIIGTMTFIYIATISTLLALILNNVAPAIIFTVLISVGLGLATTVIRLIDYEDFKYLVYLIPTFSTGSALLFNPTIDNIMFIEGVLSLVVFGGLNTFLGILVFRKKELK